MGFRLVAPEAHALRDQRVALLSAEPRDVLASRFNGRKERSRVVASSGRCYEVVAVGQFDLDGDPSTDFYVWLDVRPVAVARIPVLRWLLGASGTVISHP